MGFEWEVIGKALQICHIFNGQVTTKNTQAETWADKYFDEGAAI